ncbi:hypothetical protein [Parendozoicomonas haliclonae]|nr:hypothetical protein [Parendozoicomonas haliclonae]
MSESIQQLHQHKPTPEDKIICAHILEALSPEQSAMIVRRMLERGFFDRVAERIRQEAHILEQSNPTGAVTSSDIERAIFATFVKEGLQNQSKPISYG